jgi:cytochrome b
MTDVHDAPEMPQASAQSMVRVWDPLVRVFHWGLVAAFATAWLTADEVQPVHELAGYTVAVLVAFRLVWGFVGGRCARFAQFLRGPGATLRYLGDLGRGRRRGPPLAPHPLQPAGDRLRLAHARFLFEGEGRWLAEIAGPATATPRT